MVYIAIFYLVVVVSELSSTGHLLPDYWAVLCLEYL